MIKGVDIQEFEDQVAKEKKKKELAELKKLEAKKFEKETLSNENEYLKEFESIPKRKVTRI